MTRLHVTLPLCVPLLVACELGSVSLTSAGVDDTTTTSGAGSAATTTSDDGTTAGATTGGDPTDGTTGTPPLNAALDILFVIDNSGSMARSKVA